jgi:uncharacterized cupin superfamily protein
MLSTKKFATVIPPQSGEMMNVLGHTATLKLAQAQTEGDAYVFELVSPPNAGIPPHVHQKEDEIIYVLTGRYEIFLDGELMEATPGSVIHFACGVPHGFRNVGKNAGKTLWVVTPGINFEPFFAELGALPPGQPDLAEVARIFGKYNIDLLPLPEPA